MGEAIGEKIITRRRINRDPDVTLHMGKCYRCYSAKIPGTGENAVWISCAQTPENFEKTDGKPVNVFLMFVHAWEADETEIRRDTVSTWMAEI